MTTLRLTAEQRNLLDILVEFLPPIGPTNADSPRYSGSAVGAVIAKVSDEVVAGNLPNDLLIETESGTTTIGTVAYMTRLLTSFETLIDEGARDGTGLGRKIAFVDSYSLILEFISLKHGSGPNEGYGIKGVGGGYYAPIVLKNSA